MLQSPLFDAVKNYVDDNVAQFHVPGHKKGNGLKEFREYLGERVFQIDANGMQELDFANNPTGVIYESERLLAQAYGAQNAYFHR